MVGTTRIPFWTNPRDGSMILSKDKIKGAKPLMAGMACPFFGASTPKSVDDSTISSIMTVVGGASVLIPGGNLQRHSHK